MNQQDADKLRADMARVNESIRSTFDSRSFHDQMVQMNKVHAESMKSFTKSMDDMRKNIDTSMNRIRDAYRKTPEYKRMTDEMTARAQYVTGAVSASIIVVLAVVVMTKVLA